MDSCTTSKQIFSGMNSFFPFIFHWVLLPFYFSSILHVNLINNIADSWKTFQSILSCCWFSHGLLQLIFASHYIKNRSAHFHMKKCMTDYPGDHCQPSNLIYDIFKSYILFKKTNNLQSILKLHAVLCHFQFRFLRCLFYHILYLGLGICYLIRNNSKLNKCVVDCRN